MATTVDPVNLVVTRSPVAELNARFDPAFGATFAACMSPPLTDATANKGKQLLDVDSSETATVLAVENPVIVTEPPEIADTLKLSPKLIVPAVPTVEPLFLITTPEPEPTTPVNAEPSSDGNAPDN